jgi:hypothetical protein
VKLKARKPASPIRSSTCLWQQNITEAQERIKRGLEEERKKAAAAK